MGFVLWLSAADVTRQQHFVCVHPHEYVPVCSCVHGSRWWEQYYHRPMDSTQDRATRLCWLQQRQHDSLSLSLSLSLPLPLSLHHPPIPSVSDGWMAGNLSQSAATPLFHHLSLCSFFHFSVRMSDQSITLSVSQSIHPSACQMNIYPSSTSFPPRQSIPPSSHCGLLCCACAGACLKHESACVVVCARLFVCVLFSALMATWECVSNCVCQIAIYPPLPSAAECVWCESRSVGICWQTPPIPSITPTPSMPPSLSQPHTHTHPRVCVLCPSSHLDVPTLPASAQFSSAQLGSVD